MNRILELFSTVSQAFWTPAIWLPPNVTWSDVKPTEEARYSNFNDIYLVIPFAIVVIFIRAILETFVFRPIGITYGLGGANRKKRDDFRENETLERAYSSFNGKITDKEMQKLAEKLDMSELEIKKWLRGRKEIDRPSKLIKFTESGWRFSYYLFAFVYGIWCLWDKPWFLEIEHNWIGYPFEHVLSDEIWWYYMISLSFYSALIIKQFTDVRRRDFWQMFLHHLAAIFLLVFSFVCNFTRFGSLVLITHDVADIFLEAAKLFHYIKVKRASNVAFVFFVVVWIASRLIFYPRILLSSLFEAYNFIPFFPVYYIFNFLLALLMILNCVWTWYIVKIVVNVLTQSKLEDARSYSNEMSNEEE